MRGHTGATANSKHFQLLSLVQSEWKIGHDGLVECAPAPDGQEVEFGAQRHGVLPGFHVTLRVAGQALQRRRHCVHTPVFFLQRMGV